MAKIEIALKIAEIIAQTLTPLAIAFLGIWLQRLSGKYENSIWYSQKLIEKRIDIYEKVAPGLNDLYCFFAAVGNWKSIKLPQSLKIKRDLDKIINVYRFIFSDSVYKNYNVFMHLCFKTFTGAGQDAKLRTDPNYMRRKQAIEGG